MNLNYHLKCTRHESCNALLLQKMIFSLTPITILLSHSPSHSLSVHLPLLYPLAPIFHLLGSLSLLFSPISTSHICLGLVRGTVTCESLQDPAQHIVHNLIVKKGEKEGDREERERERREREREIRRRTLISPLVIICLSRSAPLLLPIFTYDSPSFSLPLTLPASSQARMVYQGRY